MITTVDRYQDVERINEIVLRNSEGVCPGSFLKAVIKEDIELNSASYMASGTVSFSDK
jgi:hypothetical protein